jgi:hypothetical protein
MGSKEEAEPRKRCEADGKNPYLPHLTPFRTPRSEKNAEAAGESKAPRFARLPQ